MNAICRATFAVACLLAPVASQESKATEVTLPNVENGRYFLVDPTDGGDPPAAGLGLLVVLPGGDGSAALLPFVENTILGLAASEFVGAMPTSIRWTEDQEVAWPTRRTPALDMKASTEEYVSAVVKDVSRRRRIDPERILLLAWESSGPAAYEIAMEEEQPFSGFYVAMSIFRRNEKDLARTAGLRFALDQSPSDETTPFLFAARAYSSLSESGAQAWLRRYQGGHGWRDDPVQRLRTGLAWLQSDQPAPTTPDDLLSDRTPLQNGSFELGTAGWLVTNSSGSFRAATVTDRVPDGKRALRLTRGRGQAVDSLRQAVVLPDSRQVRVSARVRTSGLRRAALRFYVHDSEGGVLNEEIELTALQGDRGWRHVSVVVDLAETADYGVFEVAMATSGQVWVDDVRIAAVQPRQSPSVPGR